MSLAPEHLADLHGSGLNDDWVKAMHCESIRPKELPVKSAESGYRIPYPHLNGSMSRFYRDKLVPPVIDADGHKIKYWQPKGSSPHAYTPPLVDWLAAAKDPALRLVVTEGEKKAAAGCQAGLWCLGFGGVWNWTSILDTGDPLIIPILDEFDWVNRPVEICPDSDAWGEGGLDILRGFFALAKELQQRKADVRFVILPDLHGLKAGLDDWLLVPGNDVAHSWPKLDRLPLDDEQFNYLNAWWQGWHERRRTRQATVSGLSGPSPEVWPEIQPVKAELLPVAPLPIKIIPPAFREWVKDVSEHMQCPPDYVATAMVVMAGSIIGAGCGIRPKKNDTWTVVPNLWGAVVGRPSMLKTPAIAEAMKPLEVLEHQAKDHYEKDVSKHKADLEEFKAKKDALQTEMRKVANGKVKPGASMENLKKGFTDLKEPAPPVWRRYKTNDPTIEKMSELQANNPRGVLYFRDELIGFFATLDKDGHEADRAYYLESWNGLHSYTSDRVGRGTIFVNNLCVSLFGGIQPTKLSTYLYAAMRGHDNDGLVQRVQLLVYPDEPATWVLIDTPINSSARQIAHEAVKRLAAIDFRQYGAYGDEGEKIPYFRFDDEGQQVFYQWWGELETKLRTQDDEPVVLEHLGKYRSLMPSLALIYHLLDIASNPSRSPGQISAQHTKCAAAWCDYLEQHARRIYGLVTNMPHQAATRLAKKLQQGRLSDGFTIRDVYRKDWSLLNDRDVIEKACDELVTLGWLREKVMLPALRQRGKTQYLINPQVKPKRDPL